MWGKAKRNNASGDLCVKLYRVSEQLVFVLVLQRERVCVSECKVSECSIELVRFDSVRK